MSVFDEYRSLNDAIKSSVDSLKSIEDMARSIYEMQYSVNSDACYRIGRMGEIYITALDSEKACLNLLYPDRNYSIPESTLKSEFESYNAELEEKGEMPVDYTGFLRHIIHEIHNTYRDLMNGNDAIRSLVSQRTSLMDSVMKLRNSDEFKEKKANQLKEIQEKIAATDDVIEKKRLQEVIDFQNTVDNMDYIMQRINSIPAERDSIVNAFFDRSKSAYIMKRAEDRFKQIGLGSFSIVRRFFNIEETFLNDNYAPLNNLFLFSALRMIANAKDEKQRICAKDIMVNLNRLFTHTFTTPEMEENFISKISEFDDVFCADADIVCRFKNENKSWSAFSDEKNEKHHRQYYKLEMRPCGVDSVLTSGRLYNYVTPNRRVAGAIATGFVEDIREHYNDVEPVMFVPHQDIGGNDVKGYDKFMEVANEALANKGQIDSKRILVLADIADSNMDVEEYKFFLMRASLLVAATGWTIINICAMSDDNEQKFEFKAPVLNSVDKIESNMGFFALRMRPMYNAGYFTMAVDVDNENSLISFMVLNGSEATTTESIYHIKCDENNKLVAIPHSILYPEEMENAANFTGASEEGETESSESDAATQEDEPNNGRIYEGEPDGYVRPDGDEILSDCKGETDHPNPIPDNVVPLVVATENGVETIPGMFIQKEGTVEMPDEEDLKVDVVTKPEAEK